MARRSLKDRVGQYVLLQTTAEANLLEKFHSLVSKETFPFCTCMVLIIQTYGIHLKKTFSQRGRG